MSALRGLNLALAFALELAALIALGYWGFSAHSGAAQKALFGIGAPLLAAVIWGLFVAPKARRPVAMPVRLALKALVFGAATLALMAAGQPTLGWIYLALVVANEALLLAFRDKPVPA